MKVTHSTISIYNTMIITPFALKFPPFSGARINECTTQGKVTRKIIKRKEIDTHFLIITIQQF
jgi:hypothetical protein